MPTKSYQNHELLLTERKARQEKSAITAARRFLRATSSAEIAVERANLEWRLDELDKTSAALRRLKKAGKTGLQPGRPPSIGAAVYDKKTEAYSYDGKGRRV